MLLTELSETLLKQKGQLKHLKYHHRSLHARVAFGKPLREGKARVI